MATEKMTYTRGPWHYDTGRDIVWTGAGTIVAVGGGFPGNAHLIAAAPCLLEAAKLAQDSIAWFLKNPEAIKEADFRSSLIFLTAAISKAEAR